METVVLDDEPLTRSQGENAIIDLDEEPSDDVIEIVEIPDDGYETSFPDISKKDAAFGELIEKCIALDGSVGMLRVINRTLVPLYKDGERKFKSYYDAQVFNKALIRTLENLENDPKHRYSHIKHICDILKKLRSKRKVPLVTISKDIRDTSRKRKYSEKKHSKPKIVGNVIHLDDDECEVNIIDNEVPYAVTDNNGEEENTIVDTDVTHLDDYDDECEVPIVNGEIPCSNANNNSEKESTFADSIVTEDKTNSTSGKHFIEIDFSNVIFDSDMFNDHLPYVHDSVEPVSSSTPNVSENTINETRTLTLDYHEGEISANDVTSSTNNMPDKEASPIIVQENDMHKQELSVEEKIMDIEKRIAKLKQQIDHYSTQEVTDDCDCSPYIQCDRYQTQLVKLYEELCNLTGCPTVKRRRVRLRAIDSRPELPMKKIEQLINNNIGPNGLPHFPDYEEVEQCVKEANYEAQLGWDSKRIEFEARGLYVHCGRVLQRTRQKREWRDLMSLVKDESLEDPADKDPELQARLTMNKLIANVKEHDVLERYNTMEMNAVRSPKSHVQWPADEMALQYYYETNINDTNNITEKEDSTNENVDNSQIKIIDVYSCKRVVSTEMLTATENNIHRVESVQCDSTKQQVEQHNSISTPMSSDVNDNFKDCYSNEYHDSSAMDIENNNLDGHNENLSQLSGVKSNHIELISIENIDDNETQNNTENVSNLNGNILQNVSNKENYVQTDPSLCQKIKIEENDDSQTDNQYLESRNINEKSHNEFQTNVYSIKENDKGTNLNGESEKNRTVIDTLHFRIKFEQNENSLPTNNQHSETWKDASMNNRVAENTKDNIDYNNKENTKQNHNLENIRESPLLQLPIKVEGNSNLINDNESVKYQNNFNPENFETNHNISTNKTANMTLIKSESEAIRELEDLGDNFTMTILDIIDPSLIIEISDSSDDEDDTLD
ncbi:unnamed protein product [Diatraea saccharalis]|uniref:Daxx histone-binding domain-containing protein n=1 Tax=Diatraea saccharalis TaxID=40085 RepID=A0A9N9WDI6_9NEOP|nr:unnamed protein product [Diatraea saccharalis]